MIYEKEVEELTVSGFICHVRVRGNLDYDDGKVAAESPSGKLRNYEVSPPAWSHDGYESVELWLPVGRLWEPVPNDLADSIYEAFCAEYSAEDLAEEFGEEPDYDEIFDRRRA